MDSKSLYPDICAIMAWQPGNSLMLSQAFYDVVHFYLKKKNRPAYITLY